MKTVIGVISLGFLVSACASYTGAVPAAEIESMSGSQIKVAYTDGVSGMGDASKIAKEYCDPKGAASAGSSMGSGMPDKTVVSFNCK